MSDIFANLRSGVQFPQVVMNQGPMPGTGGLPRPLHDSVDGRINYNSSLLGDLSPYAYGEPGYLSSQTAYLNIPHKLQKLVPPVFLPEAKVASNEFFDLSHPVDDGDLAFTLRLDRNSLFCSGLRAGGARRSTTGTAIDPLVNLATVNYILSGLQLANFSDPSKTLWSELAHNLSSIRGSGPRTRETFQKFDLGTLIDVVRYSIRPFGIVRGSERQGGQNEATPSPATWPVSFVTSITLDGKESNVMNMWHFQGLSAGEDLVLRLKPMPVLPYTLNHYYKGVKRQSWGIADKCVWQLVPDKFHLEPPDVEKEVALLTKALSKVPPQFRRLRGEEVTASKPWQELGYWHIGRAQIMSGKYGVEEYWHNDLANTLRTNHLDMTLQPMFACLPRAWAPSKPPAPPAPPAPSGPGTKRPCVRDWEPKLALERLPVPRPAPQVAAVAAPVEVEEERGWEQDLGLPPAAPEPAIPADEDLGLDLLLDPAPPPPVGKKGGRGKKSAVGGTLLRADGSSEPSMVGML
jgi:hypothetical protein